MLVIEASTSRKAHESARSNHVTVVLESNLRKHKMGQKTNPIGNRLEHKRISNWAVEETMAIRLQRMKKLENIFMHDYLSQCFKRYN